MSAPPATEAETLAGLLARLCPRRRIDLAGAVSLPRVLPHADAFRGWLAAGRHGELSYLARDPAGRLDPLRQRPWARCVLVFGQRYVAGWRADDPAPWAGAAAGRPWIDGVARYARGRDYHDVLRADVKAVLDGLREALGPLRAHVAIDTGPYLEREYAWLAGLGFFGRNTCLIHERLGSGLFLGLVVTDLAVAGLPPSGEAAAAPLWSVAPRPEGAGDGASRCGGCRLCVEACPTGALDGAFGLDARRCLSAWTIERRGPAPAGQEEAAGTLVFGCDICQAVCPWNRRAAREATSAPPPRDAYAADPAHGELDLEGLAALDDAEFARRFRRSPLWRARPDGLRQNALAALRARERAP